MVQPRRLSIITIANAYSGHSMVKNLPANEGAAGWIPGSRRSPGEGNDNPLQYSCLRNPMDRGAWRICCPVKSSGIKAISICYDSVFRSQGSRNGLPRRSGLEFLMRLQPRYWLGRQIHLVEIVHRRLRLEPACRVLISAKI